MAGLVLATVAASLIAFWSLAPGLQSYSVPLWPGAEFTDLMTAHLPSAAYIHRAVGLYGQIPGWNPTILSGMPVQADPLSSIAYPPHWPLIILPTPATATVLAALHLVFGSVGLAVFLLRRVQSAVGVTVAAIAFAGMPKLIGHFALGHLTTVYAVSWTPWLLLCCDRAVPQDDARAPSKRWTAAAGAVWALTVLADIRWSLIAGMLALGYLAYRINALQSRHWSALARGALYGALPGVLLPAVHLVPLWFWWQISNRSALSLAERLESSLPPVQLLSLLLPPWGAWPEWIAYGGVSVLILALLALLGRSTGARFWWIVIAASVLISLGDHLPLIGPLLFRVPGLSGLRVPPRFLFAGGLGLAVLAGLGIDELEQLSARAVRRIRRLSAASLAVGLATGMLILLPGTASALTNSTLSGLTLLAIGAAGAGILLLVQSISGHRLSQRLSWVWVVLIALDLGLFNRSLLEGRSKDPPPAVIETVGELSPGARYRTFSPSLLIAPYYAAIAGLELADGVHPLIYEPYWVHMAGATGYDPQGYSVTLPPLPTGEPDAPWGVEPDPGALGRLNVLYLVSSYEISADGWSRLPESERPGEFVYLNEQWRPRAWVEAAGGHSEAHVDWSPGSIRIRAEGPGRLIISELAVPGWNLEIDGEEVTPLAGAAPLTALELGPGEHLVKMRYRAPGGAVGLAATVLGLLMLAWIRWRT